MLQETFKTRRLLLRSVLPAIAACVIGTAAGGFAAQDPDAQSPQVSGNLPINAPQALFPQGNPTRNTSSIAPSLDGRRLLVGYEDDQGLCGPPSNLQCTPVNPPGYSAYAFSTDGGTSWTNAGSPLPIGSAISAGHPWVSRLGRGSDEERSEDGGRGGRDSDFYFMVNRMQNGTTGAPAGLGIYRGQFGGGTFAFEGGQIINSANTAGDFYSRAEVAAAKDGSSSAYVSLSNIDEICDVPFAGFGQIELWRTHDGGETWQGPAIPGPETSLILDPNNPQCGNQGFLQIAPDLAIGARGEVYVVWEYGPEFFPDASNLPIDWIAFSRSIDGGKTFSAPTKIVQLNSLREDPPVGYGKNRLNDQPRIAVATSGPHRGRIYVGFYSAVSPVLAPITTQVLVSSEAFVFFSDDGGNTWSTPTTVAAPVPPTGVKRLWPTVSIRPDGAVDVVYLESQETVTGTTCDVQIGAGAHRTGPASSLVDTFWVESRDGGQTFSPPVRVSSQTSNWCTAPYIAKGLTSNAGDYIGTASVSGQTLITWPDDRNGPMDLFFATLRGEVSGRHDGDGGHR